MADNSTRIIITAEDQASGPIGAISRNIQQLGNAVPVAQQQMSSFVSLLKGGLVGIAAGFTVDALVGNIGKTISALAELDDMAERTGASVESLSALGRVAKISGQDMATVEQGIVRLTKALSGADEESKGAAKALKDIGLSIDDLRGKNSAEAFKAVADGLAKFEDGAGKTSVALDLFGRNGAALLPFLKDLAEEGELVGKVTAEQAAQAEHYEKTMARLSATTGRLGKTIALELLPVLDAAATKFEKILNNPTEKVEIGWIDASFNWLSNRLNDMVAETSSWQVKMYRALGVDSWAAQAQKNLDAARAKTADFALRQQEIAERGVSLDAFGGAGGSVKSSALNGRKSRTGDDGSSKIARDRANEFAAEQAAAQAWAKTMGDLARITAEATDAGLGYSKAQREIVALIGSSAWGKLATETKIAALAAYDAAQAAETEAEAIKATNESRRAQAALAEKIAEQRRDELDKLQAQVIEQQRHNEEIGLSTEALQDLKLARLDDVIAIEEQRAALSAMDAETEADLANIRARVAALRTLRQATAEGFQKQNATDASKAAAEAAERQWRQTSETIEKSLTDALMRGFESGKGFGENLRDTLENLFATMVLRPVIQAAVQPLAGGITNAIGFGGGGSAGNLLSAGNTLMNFGSSLSVGSLAAANAVGAVGGDALGTLIAGNASNWGVSAAGVGAMEAGAASIGTALPWIGGALAVGSLLGAFEDDGPAARSANFRSGLAMSTGVGAGESNNAIDATQWFSSEMNASLNEFQKRVAAQEKAVIDALGLTAAQQNKISANLYAIGDRRYNFGMEGTDWQQSGAAEAIIADRMQVIADTLGMSVADINAAVAQPVSKLREQFRSLFEDETERLARQSADLAAQFKKLGVEMPATRAAYEDLVDASTGKLERGLLRLAPAVDALFDITEKAAAEAAAKAEAQAAALLAAGRRLDIELMRVRGDTAGATAAERADTLAALDPSLRNRQQQIYDAMDAAEAAAAAIAKAQESAAAAHDALIARYQREDDALRGIIDEMDGFGQSLTSFRASLAPPGSTTVGYDQRRRNFADTGLAAIGGDAVALAGLQDAASGFLDASASRARSRLDLARDQAVVDAVIGDAIATASGLAGAARSRLHSSDSAVDQIAQMRAELRAGLSAVAKAGAETARVLRQWNGDGMPETRVTP